MGNKGGNDRNAGNQGGNVENGGGNARNQKEMQGTRVVMREIGLGTHRMRVGMQGIRVGIFV